MEAIMGGRTVSARGLCAFCLQAQRRHLLMSGYSRISRPSPRSFSTVPPLRQDAPSSTNNEEKKSALPDDASREEGAMSRRLAEMTEQSMTEGGRSARKNIQEAGFSEELKKQLEERLAASAFKSENAAAISVANMPSSAGRGTQDIAAAPAWTGSESVQDATLRMLDDASKPIKTPYKIPKPGLPSVSLAPSPKTKQSSGQRLASARERTINYSLSQDSGMSEAEREALRKEFRERFTPGARVMPMSIQGLQSLANERIEDAMARGQFKNIRRGKGQGTQEDHNANSAFIDTTEYFMNKIIQKQEIVPPWIEKQQELAREVDRFRQRIRSDWRRHAARLIASQGGSLIDQMKRARAYAAAESRLTAQRLASVASDSDQSVTQINSDGRIVPSRTPSSEQDSTSPPTESSEEPLPHLPPLRDPEYLSIERGYHELTIKTLNALTRSYNLQAPAMAQKPYLNLERELTNCYADVAPSLADEIKRRATERARGPALPPSQRSSSVFEMLATKQATRVYSEDPSKEYGFKDFWKDLFGRKKEGQTG
ncbi:hypothetical protein DTO271D3_6905 [Paecilomyces variotii]|nr:hypothetical protein DTO169E5_993 [Paecilomyces variotii]KAJ9312830.1 hypothetical protein DTO271D3_6905 [Paecilomyces variotii]